MAGGTAGRAPLAFRGNHLPKPGGRAVPHSIRWADEDGETVFASDGAEAIRAYMSVGKSEHPFDLVIFDLTVPGGMGGKDALQELLKTPPPGFIAALAFEVKTKSITRRSWSACCPRWRGAGWARCWRYRG